MLSRKVFLNLMISILLVLGLATGVSAQDLPSGVDESQQYAINYRAYVSNIGWENFIKSPQEAGTTGKALPMEALEIQKDSANKVSLSVQPHVQDIGWSATRS